MPRRKLTHTPEELIQAGREFVKANADTKAGYRAAMVMLHLRGTPIETISDCMNEHRNTISNWVRGVDQIGFKSLIAVKQEGRPCKLTDEQKQVVKQAVQEDASKEGYAVWQGSTVSAFIKKKFGIELKTRACQNLLKELGFVLIRPQTYPNAGKDNAAERAEFKKNSATTI